MVNFGNYNKLALGIISMLQVLLLFSCKAEDDFRYEGGVGSDNVYNETDDNDSTTTPELDCLTTYTDTVIRNNTTYKGSIQVLKSHTSGKGFPIIIMADGYTSTDISDGTYRNVSKKAQEALFALEPMKSLQQYFDIIEVAVPSSESGVTSTQKNTALGTHYATNGTQVYGDSIAIDKWVGKAIKNVYGITASSALKYKYARSQTVVLLNCTAYKGVTWMSCDETVKDTIPNGNALSYIPANCKISDRDVFTDIIQHEAVGHGIGKLADEYYTVSATSPSQAAITEFQNMQRYGFFANASYSTDEDCDTLKLGYINAGMGVRIDVKGHYLTSADAAYPLTKDARYSNEDIKWYQGGYTFLTYAIDKTATPASVYFKKEFYRPSAYCIMNATTDTHNSTFNVVSRLAIYKRVMRVAKGNLFTCHLNKAADLEAFATFDAPSRTTSSGAKGVTAPAVPEFLLNNDMPQLAAPQFIKK